MFDSFILPPFAHPSSRPPTAAPPPADVWAIKRRAPGPAAR